MSSKPIVQQFQKQLNFYANEKLLTLWIESDTFCF